MGSVFAVRYIGLAALVTWLGGMIVLGLLVAPSIFRVLQGSDPAAGRMLAGAVFGDILRQFHLLAYVCGGLVLISLVFEKLIAAEKLIGAKLTAARTRDLSLRAAIAIVMLAIAVYSGVPLTRAIVQVQSTPASASQRSWGPHEQELSLAPPRDPRRARFDRLHATSTTLMTVNMALGLVLLSWYVRE
jgi:uncharacterized membrane protein